MRKPIRRARDWQRRGAATVEMAVAAPLLVAIVFGSIDVGQYVNVGQIVDNASREGARQAVKHTTLTVTEVDAAIQNYLANAFPGVATSTLNAALQVTIRDGSGNTISGANLALAPVGSSVSVQVVLQYDAVRWSAIASFLNSRSIQTSTTMRRE